MRLDLAVEKLDELWLHELIVVRDAEAHDARASQLLQELARQLPLVLLLHYEDNLGPLDKLGRQRVLGIVVRAGGGAFEAWSVGKYLFRSGATQAVLAANEQDAGQAAVTLEVAKLRQRQSVLLNKAI